MQQTIKQYIRNPESRQPRGVALAVRKGDEVRYGYSLLNITSDKFNKEKGIKIATCRAMSDSYKLPTVPEREVMVASAFNHLEKRALKFFKDIDPDKVKLCPTNIESPYVEE